MRFIGNQSDVSCTPPIQRSTLQKMHLVLCPGDPGDFPKSQTQPRAPLHLSLTVCSGQLHSARCLSRSI